jgi:cytochrome d ubiquinol oxidase subunit I
MPDGVAWGKDHMSSLDLARWQFGIVTVYHYLFVPLTIGLSVLVALMQTRWHRTGDERWLRMTKFWGKLFLINFALGVVTGIVQEFQFGMNWSDYSRYVGDVFGAPLAMEGLLAFFLESTFLGLWIFGWDRLPKRVHLACIWIAAFGVNLSAYFILAANSWMQHPVGYVINTENGRAELTSIWAVLTNSTLLAAYPHTIAGGFLVAGTFVGAISVWSMRKGANRDAFRATARLGFATAVVATVVVSASGHVTAQIMTEQQPMKMAAAEALWDTESSAGFSVFAVGDIRNGRNHVNLQIPRGLSLLSTNSLDGEVKGINDLQREYEQTYGPGNYKPVVGIAYWSFRLMIGFGLLAGMVAVAWLWWTRRGRTPTSRWKYVVGSWSLGLLFAANAMGWVFTEMGRQPWTVFGVLSTADSDSPTVAAWQVASSLGTYTVVYAVLAVVEVRLIVQYVRAGLPEVAAPSDTDDRDRERPLAFAY